MPTPETLRDLYRDALGLRTFADAHYSVRVAERLALVLAQLEARIGSVPTAEPHTVVNLGREMDALRRNLAECGLTEESAICKQALAFLIWN